MNRIVVYSATDGSGRTRTYPWRSAAAVPREIDVAGVTFLLVADSRVTDDLEATQARRRAWNAGPGANGRAGA